MRNIKKQWVFPELLEIPGKFQAMIGGSTVVSQFLFRKGLTTFESAQAFLNPDHYKPTPGATLPNLERAVNRIKSALINNEMILIWGDFDVDGQTSTALLVSALRDLGGAISHYIPNRAKESHGVYIDSLREKISQYTPSLLITCDTGIDAIEPVAYAQSHNIDVIITDHHQLPPALPDAFAIVNPNQLPDGHALADLPGVGVVFKIIEHLYNSYHREVNHLLDLVALGIVADVARLSGDTRYLLQRGLPILRETSRLGLIELFKAADISPGDISEDHIGYIIGPRLNALGRLDDANSCVDFFTTSNSASAAQMATHLENLNLQRQELTERIFQESITLVEANPDLIEDFPILVLQGPPDWNPGVTGIVASRLVDRFSKPVVMLTQEGDQARGSARSLPGIPIAELFTDSSELLLSYGGHPMAAGLRLQLDNVSQFRRRLAQSFTNIVGEDPTLPETIIDAVLPFQSISVDFINDFLRLAPFGSGNPKPLFASLGVNVLQDTTIGKNQNHRKLTVKDSAGSRQDILWWNSIGINLPNGPIDLVYSLDLSYYRNQSQTQITLQDFRQSSDTPLIVKDKASLEIIDYRNHLNPLKILPGLISEFPDAIIWAEYNSPTGMDVYQRGELYPSSTLIIWTTPPNPIIFQQALNSVSPERIILFAIDPMPQVTRTIIEAILGLLRHLRDSEKSYDLDLFSQTIAQTSALIEIGLEWIHHHGDYDLSQLADQNLINPGSGNPLPDFQVIDAKFSLLLSEISAYRLYFRNAGHDYLL